MNLIKTEYRKYVPGRTHICFFYDIQAFRSMVIQELQEILNNSKGADGEDIRYMIKELRNKL